MLHAYLQLSYSSSNTNERNSTTSPASSVGDGFSLSLGSIGVENYPSSSANGAQTWYFLSGVSNVSDRLIQDTTITSGTFYLTEHISHLRIQQVGGTNGCFHVYDTSGTYYEFGCTSDSLQYRKDSDGTLHIYRYDLNKIVAPNDGPSSTLKVLTVSYGQDCVPAASPCPASSASGSTTIRDAAMKQIVYGTQAPGAGLQVDGTVDFTYLAPNAASPWATAYGTNYNCVGSPPQSTPLRCDDPVGGTAAAIMPPAS